MTAKAAARRAGSVLGRAALGFARDDGAALAGYMAYSALLALFPFLIFATALLGLLIGEEGLQPALAFIFDVLPEHVARTIEPVVHEVVRNRSGGVLSASALGAVWVASNGVEALRVALDRAYGVSTRRAFWKSRLIAIGFTLAGVAAFGLLAVFIVLGPALAALASAYLALGEEVLSLWHGLRYLAGALAMLGFLIACHAALPAERPRAPLLPGVLLTLLAWMALASLFSVYFRYAPSYAVTYGALGGVIATLLFFYLSSAIFIFGAEVNAARDPRPGQRREAADSAPLI